MTSVRKIGWLGSLFVALTAFGVATGQTGVVGANFTTMTVVQVAATGGFGVPPDTTGVVGTNHFMQYNNGGTVIYRKDGSVARAFSRESTFWNTIGGLSVSPAGDPRLIFDPLNGRYFAVAFTGGNNNSILISRSDTADPTGTWRAVAVTNNNGLFADYPTLGMDRNGLYIGVNKFNGNTSAGVDVYSIPIADLIQGTPSLTNITRFVNTNTGFTTQGVNNFNLGQSNSSTGSLVSGNFSNAIRHTPVNGAGGAGATLGTNSTPGVASNTSPPNVRPPDAANTGLSATQIDTGDNRLGSAVYRVGNLLYMTRSVSSNGGTQSAVRVTVMSLSGTTMTLLTEATLGGNSATNADPNFNSFYPSIAANANGDIVVGYTRTGFISSGNSDNRWLSSYASIGKLTGSTLTFGAPVQLHAGERDYVSFQGTGTANRWGDYSATNLDPSDPGIFWTTQEYASNSVTSSSATNWATRATELIPTVAGEVRWASVATGALGGSGANAAGRTGNFVDAANWYNGVVPVSTDHVLFSRNGDGTTAYTVAMPLGTTSLDRASVRQGAVNWTIDAGNSVSLTNTGTDTPSLSVSEYLGTSTLTVSGGGTLNSVTTTVAAGRNSDAAYNGVSANAFNASLGTLTVSGAGTTWNNSGAVFVGGTDTNPGGTGTLNVNSGATAVIGGNLSLYNLPTGRTANRVNVGATSAAALTVGGLASPGSGSVAPVVNLANASSLTINGSGSATYGGTIIGTGSVTKNGSGTQTFTGTNTYSGNTTISGGTLTLGASGSINASPVIAVGSGATYNVAAVSGGYVLGGGSTSQTLRGTGTVTGGTRVNTGSVVLGGDGVFAGQQLNTGTLTFSNNGVLRAVAGDGATANNTTLTGASRVAATGNFGRAASSGLIRLELIEDGTLAEFTQYTRRVGTYSGSLTNLSAGTYGLADNVFAVAGSNMGIADTWQVTVGSGSIDVVFTPVPEPATLAGIGLALFLPAAAWRRWRSRRNADKILAA